MTAMVAWIKFNQMTNTLEPAPVSDLGRVPTLAGFIREHLTWVLGLVPFAVAAINLLVLSGGNPQTFGYLLQSLNIVSLLLGVVIPLIPLIIIWGALVWFIVDRIRPKVPYSANRFMADAVVATGFAFCVVTALLGYLAIIAGSFVMHAFGNLLVWLKNRKRQRIFGARALIPRFEYGYGVLFQYLVFACLLSALFLPQTWLPTEVVTVKSAKPATGRILSSTEDWTIYMEPGLGGKVNVVHTTDVESRVPCILQPTVFAKSIAGVLAQRRDRVNEILCPD